ncbi:hypothetical protein [Massilia eurypsychrophila]|jgi:hypothetical protein|uniref:hypothetical protein n=1 Tax=Massilia eurypsychrophila TaxID=1485217 RepID=UPI0010336743|nr:hypothetical protein [Massilia eurypsychrophila]
MKNALTTTHAAASACLCGRLAFVRAVVLGGAIACAGAPAFAQERDNDGRRQAPPQQVQPRDQPRGERMPPQQRVDPRQYDQAPEARAEEQRRQAAQHQDQGRRGGRLTPDERRELRRQINEAGNDLYPNAPRR